MKSKEQLEVERKFWKKKRTELDKRMDISMLSILRKF